MAKKTPRFRRRPCLNILCFKTTRRRDRKPRFAKPMHALKQSGASGKRNAKASACAIYAYNRLRILYRQLQCGHYFIAARTGMIMQKLDYAVKIGHRYSFQSVGGTPRLGQNRSLYRPILPPFRRFSDRFSGFCTSVAGVIPYSRPQSQAEIWGRAVIRSFVMIIGNRVSVILDELGKPYGYTKTGQRTSRRALSPSQANMTPNAKTRQSAI